MTTRFLIIIILAGLLAPACATLEERCAERFPQSVEERIVQRTVTDTIILPFRTVEYMDTTICPPADTPTVIVRTIIKTFPPDTVLHETMCVDTFLISTDQPKINWLTAELETAQAKFQQSRSSSNSKSWVITALALVLAVLIYLLVSSKRPRNAY